MDQFQVPADPKEPFSYQHAGQLLGGISLPGVYDLMYSGLLTTVSIGRRRFVTMESVEACRKALATDVGQKKLAQRKAAKTRSGNR